MFSLEGIFDVASFFPWVSTMIHQGTPASASPQRLVINS